MPCYRPLQAWRQPGALKPGEARMVFSKHDPCMKAIDLPCGQCLGCRLERSRRWAVRIMHEAQMHECNSFLTLTYDEKCVPPGGTLRVEDFQLFMKRLRRGSSGPLRFFHCGEYGDDGERPHYHCCLFGEDFRSDRVFYKKTKRGDELFTSPRLSEAWGNGNVWIGELTFESAAYVARYCLKKAQIAGKAGESLDDRLSAYSKWLAGRKPEYVTMSRRPGIGSGWFARYGDEVFPSDEVVVRRSASYVAMLPPPFYDKLLEKADPALFEQVKKARRREAGSFYDSPDNFSRRLIDREEVKRQTVANALQRNDHDG